MTRDEFLSRLGELLACLPAEQVEETKAFYAEAIADRMEDGMTEAEAVAAMGTPGEVAEATLDELPAVPRAIARTKRKSTAFYGRSPSWAPRYGFHCCSRSSPLLLRSTSASGFLRFACGSWPWLSRAQAWWNSCLR